MLLGVAFLARHGLVRAVSTEVRELHADPRYLQPMPKRRAAPRSSAPAPSIVPATTGPLAASHEPVLREALLRAEETRNVVEDALVSFGRWLLVHVFEGDSTQALAARKENPLWNELQRRAGGPSLRLSRRFLSVALHIAAHDQRIQDDAWRLLEPGRKELLLPLHDEAALREAAQHVVKLKLSQRATKTYVKSLRAEAAPRMRLTSERARADIARFSEKVVDARYEKRVHALVKQMSGEERAAMKEEVARVRAWADRLAKAIREA